jgi:hypothetical protein
MTLDEMNKTASEALGYFIKTMPDVPFTEKDIVFSFAEKSEMVKRLLELRAEHCPEKIHTDSQLKQLGESIAGNAMLGREKSVVLMRSDMKIGKKDFRRIVIHELMHLFCEMLEMDEEHFIDIYGTGTTYDVSAEEDKTYDGMIVAGYTVWSEFIAEYYAVKLVEKNRFAFVQIAETVEQSFCEVTVEDLDDSKKSFAMLCAYWFNCVDFAESYEALHKPDTFMRVDEPHGEDTQNALLVCVKHIYNQMQKDKPWKISEEFICDLGVKFSFFRLQNSLYLSC